MKVTIFGSTGTIGKQVVHQALLEGHEVTAFVRNPEKMAVSHPQLRLVQGDVRKDIEQIEAAVSGQDAVIVTLGAGARGAIRSEGTRNIIWAMKKQGCRKLICQSTLGAGESSVELNFKWWLLFRGPLRWAMADHEKQEKYVRESDLDWTIVRPSSFTDGPQTGQYEVGNPIQASSLRLTISRADVAQFLLKVIGDQRFQSQAVSLSN